MNSISLWAAFIAGFFSFVNPCVLPLIPGFLSYLSGVSLTTSAGRFNIFINTLFFVFGFSLVFALVGMLLNSVFSVLSQQVATFLSVFGGAVIILFGLNVLGFVRIPFLEKEYKLSVRGLKPSYFLSFVFGATFAAGWSPCVGALLASVLALAAVSPKQGFLFLSAYALGFGVPFLFVGFFSSEAIRVISKTKSIFKYFNLVVGVFVVILGIFIMTGRLSYVPQIKTGGVSRTVAPPEVFDGAFLERAAIKEKKYPKAQELVTPDGFINTEPIALRDIVGKKVILLDFWTYSCINCQRTFPFLRAWYARYKSDGLEIIAVHSPEFGFEKKYENVAAAVKKWGIPFPVVLDNKHANLALYDTVYWPTKYLIDIDGFVVYKHIGEGGYRETENMIHELLEERRKVLGEAMRLPDRSVVTPKDSVEVDFLKIGTPEIYFGASMNRGNFGNPEGLRLGEAIEYKTPSFYKPNEVYVGGIWYNGTDNLELKSGRGKIVLVYRSKVVNIVAGSTKDKVNLRVKIDGKALLAGQCGRDVAAGGTFEVGAFDLYNLVCGRDYGTHRLEIEIEGQGLAIYAFTFG